MYDELARRQRYDGAHLSQPPVPGATEKTPPELGSVRQPKRGADNEGFEVHGRWGRERE
jgi:hypothetical protein